ncbi:MAG: FtsW/RodA/SpoVE family cell cycle protein [Candidatus Contendobacter sp.]
MQIPSALETPARNSQIVIVFTEQFISKMVLGNLPAWLTGILLLALWAAGWRLLEQAPAGHQVTEVRVTLTGKEQPVILGYLELGQHPGSGRSAERDHLRLHRDASGGWWASNVADNRKVDAPTEKHETRYLKRWRLAAGDRIRVKTTELEVTEAQPEKLILREAGREARWEDGQLITTETSFAGCPDEGTPGWWGWHFKRDQELRLFSLGGEVPCPQRWELPGVPPRGVAVHWRDGYFWLAPGTAEARMARAGEAVWRGFKDIEWRLDDPAEPVKSLILGRTRYQVDWKENVLRLTPSQKADIWSEADWTKAQSQQRDSRVDVISAPVRTTSGIGGLGKWLIDHWGGSLAALGLALCAAVLVFRRPANRDQKMLRVLQATAWASALALGTLTLITRRTPETQLAWLLLSLGLAWSSASILLFIEGRLRDPVGWLWVASIGLVGGGSLVQGQLGLGGDNSRWLDSTMGHWRVLAVIGWILVPLTLVRGATWRRLTVWALDPWTNIGFWFRFTLILGVLALIVLGFQYRFGGEEGIWGIQPVEGIKVLLALMLAHAGAQWWRWRAGLSDAHRLHPVRTSLSILGLSLVFVIGASILLVTVDDLSPALLLMLLLFPMSWHCAPHPVLRTARNWKMRGVVALLVALSFGFLLWVYHAPEQLPHWIPQYHRFMVWADPAHFPESGFQTQRAVELVAAGGWFGAAPTPFGWNGDVMHLPAVQNDFIGSFLLHRFGILAGWSLLIFQWMFAMALFALAYRVKEWGQQKNAPEKATGIFLSLALFAMAWLLLAHWTIAWSNTLGLLPVMGQPMTFISSANSHHLLFAMPGLILGLVTGWMTQSSSHAPEPP